jgi:hypothetical protein
MHSIPARPRFTYLLLALVLALGASLPGASLAAAPARPVGSSGAPLASTYPDHAPAWTADTAIDAAARFTAAAQLTADLRLATAGRRIAAENFRTAPIAAVALITPVVAKAPATAPAYAGRNHIWIPSLGISHSVATFSCTRSTPPGSGVYRWGCAGNNNAYLFGHAWSTFKPLHDAYVKGRLATGMVAYYADGSGRVRRYIVTEIKVVTPDQTDWAIAAQSVPSMTLQTCVGANSQYRLLVRLVATN